MTVKKWRHMLLLICVIWSSNVVNAEASDTLFPVFQFSFGNFDRTSRTDRVGIAQALLKEVQELESFIPALRPSESEWLERETRAANEIHDSEAKFIRRKIILTSPEHHIQELKWQLEAVRNSLSCVTANSTPLDREIVCWTVASLQLMKKSVFDESIEGLIKTGRLPKDFSSKKLLSYGTLFNIYGHNIIEHLILPHLVSQAKLPPVQHLKDFAIGRRPK